MIRKDSYDWNLSPSFFRLKKKKKKRGVCNLQDNDCASSANSTWLIQIHPCPIHFTLETLLFWLGSGGKRSHMHPLIYDMASTVQCPGYQTYSRRSTIKSPPMLLFIMQMYHGLSRERIQHFFIIFYFLIIFILDTSALHCMDKIKELYNFMNVSWF